MTTPIHHWHPLTVKQTVDLYGKAEHLDAYEFEGEHTFPEEGRRAAYVWLKRWL